MLPSEQQQHSKTETEKYLTLKERHMGSLFISSSSIAHPGYLMLGWRVRQHFIFVSVHIPEEYFSIPKHCRRQESQGLQFMNYNP